MTYPPQQPGPYGPQYGPPQPPPRAQGPGGFPQQPGYQPTAQFGAPGGHPGGPVGPGGPRRRRRALPWVLGGGALVAVIVLVGGLVWPAWFVHRSQSAFADPAKAADDFASSLRSNDPSSLGQVSCDITLINEYHDFLLTAKINAQLIGAPRPNGGSDVVDFTVAVNGGQPASWSTDLVQRHGLWCVEGLPSVVTNSATGSGSGGSSSPTTGSAGSSSGGSGGSNPGGAQQAAQQFVQAMNTNDTTTLGRLTCSGADRATINYVVGAIQSHAQVTLDGPVRADPSGHVAQATGTVAVNGTDQQFNGGLMNENGTWCVVYIIPASGSDGGGSGGGSDSVSPTS